MTDNIALRGFCYVDLTTETSFPKLNSESAWARIPGFRLLLPPEFPSFLLVGVAVPERSPSLCDAATYAPGILVPKLIAISGRRSWTIYSRYVEPAKAIKEQWGSPFQGCRSHIAAARSASPGRALPWAVFGFNVSGRLFQRRWCPRATSAATGAASICAPNPSATTPLAIRLVPATVP